MQPCCAYAKVEQLLRALTRACSAEHAPLSLSSLLQAVTESGFLEGPLMRYLTTHTRDDSLQGEEAEGVVVVTVTLMRRLPSLTAAKVEGLLAVLQSWVARHAGQGNYRDITDMLRVGSDS